MSFPWVPVMIGVCVVGAVCKTGRRKDYGVLTDERKRIYQAALSGAIKNAADLRKLAAAFHGQGLFPQAAMLEKRAALKERTPEIKAAHDMAFRRALASTNRSAIMDVSQAFASLGATGAAAKLMQRAAGLPDPGEVEEEVSQTPEDEQPIEEAAPDVSSAAAPVIEEETPIRRIGGVITEESTAPQREVNSLPESTGAVETPRVFVTEGHTVSN